MCAYQVSRDATKPAAGKQEPTGMMKTPAPTRPAPPDEVTELRHPANLRSGLGMNGYSGASSLTPGQQKLSPLAENLQASGEAPDGLTLDHIIQHGTARDSSVDLMSAQTRDVSKERYPATFGHKSRTADAGSPGGMVPSHCGAPVTDDSASRRDQAMKRTDGRS